MGGGFLFLLFPFDLFKDVSLNIITVEGPPEEAISANGFYHCRRQTGPDL